MRTDRSIARIAPADAKAIVARGAAVIVDVRERSELWATGKVPGALHIPRRAIERKADPDSPDHEPRLRKEKAVILYCGSGKRSEAAGLALVSLGYREVFNLGGLKDWAAAGLPTEQVFD
jgi:rhodanese-related sulfurtransferase